MAVTIAHFLWMVNTIHAPVVEADMAFYKGHGV
jgi:hypothetical protein